MCKSAVLFSKRDYLLAEGIRYVCREEKVTLTYCLTAAELLFQTLTSKPEIIFYDEENIEFSYVQYKEFVNSKLFYIPKIVLITTNPSKFNFSEINIKIVDKRNILEEVPLVLKTTIEKAAKTLDPQYIELVKEKTARILNDIGITPKFLGYDYIKELVSLIIKDKRLMQSFNKKLYPILAMAVNTNVNNIERNIRNAILVASKRSKNKKLFDEICNRNSLIVHSVIPSNKQFLTWIVEQVA